ncbi:MAG: hypothetical protein HY980_04615 [Candidatus Magasanikbacteria bacterium]|nr:hypothetical protein [Candidatus Magasanikbacteria bacterium]
MKAKNLLLLSIGAVLLAASFAVAGVFYFKLKNVSEEMPVIPKQEEQSNQNELSQPIVSIITTGTDQFGNFVSTDNIKDYTENFKTSGLDVEWFGGAIPVSGKDTDELLNKKFPDYLKIKDEVNKQKDACYAKKGAKWCYTQDPNIYLFKVGKIKNLNDLILYYVYIPQLYQSGMGDITAVWLAFYETKTNSFIAVLSPDKLSESLSLFPKSNGSYGFGGASEGETDEYFKEMRETFSDFNVFGGYIVYGFNELSKTPSVVNVPNTKSKIVALNESNYLYSAIGDYGDAGIKNYNKREVVTDQYKRLPVAFQTEEGLDFLLDEQCYYIVKPNGTIIRYSLVPDFMSWETETAKEYYGTYYETNITWNDGSKNGDTYMEGGDYNSRGCGGPLLALCTNTVNKKAWFDASQLVRTGTGESGEKIFEIKNAVDNEFYKDAFYKVFLPDTNTQFFSDFLKDHPIIFWQDHLGSWRTFKKTKYQPQAECGKPVIYLYPEKEMDVKVQLKPNGGFTKTEPVYDNGWLVRATPQSELFNYADQTNYPYLFWEGHAYGFTSPDNGFVMSKAEVGVKMAQILGQLGLNEKETKDFLEFWQPKLEAKPYVFVTFVPQREFDKAAPLSVNPKPDTIIRVFMDYTLLDAPIEVAPMQIRTPERVGFTVVEWGGRLH